MDLLTQCAVNYQTLLNCEYRFTLGRKGKLIELILRFSESDFHHLAGLHKLKDLHIARANRSTVFRQILCGKITYQTISKSQFFPEIQDRINTLPHLATLLDSDHLIFRYHRNAFPHSSIESEFLLKMGDGATLDITFLFLDRSKQDVNFCRSFFPMSKTDYSKGQMRYTLLNKEKHHLIPATASSSTTNSTNPI